MNQLFEPINVGNVEFKNRIVFPPMSTAFERKGEITRRSIDFYTTLARGGVGLIILGDVLIVPELTSVPCISDDKFLPMLRKLTKSVREQGASISPQLFHSESYYLSNVRRALPRARAERRLEQLAKLQEEMENSVNTLTITQIEEIQDKYVDAAKRARAAGFDVIQIHGGRQVSLFTSSRMNKRTDGYGGNLRNRARFALEIVKRVREEMGNGFPIDYKLGIRRVSGKSGPTLEESKTFAKWLVDAGVNMFHITRANHGAVHQIIPPMGVPYGCFVELAEAIKKVVDVPITAVGRIVDPEYAEEIISDGKADFIGIGRGLVADPKWPIKAKEGRYNDIRKCVMCNQCVDFLGRGEGISCTVNTAAGREATSQITQAATIKNVLVVGGGPSGMEAARIAALRGHKVTLIEKTNELGGQLNLASIPPYKDELSHITKYLIHQIEKLGINVRLRKECTLTMVKEINPDEVIIATGSTPLIPNVPGIKEKNVTTAWNVLAGNADVGRNPVVVGGGLVGCETAEFLAANGKQVTIVEMLNQIGTDMVSTVKPYFMQRVNEHGIKVLINNRLMAITEKGIITVDKQQQKHTIESDTVILALGAQSNDKLAKEMKEKGINVHSIGDCVTPRKLIDAIHDGFFTALKI